MSKSFQFTRRDLLAKVAAGAAIVASADAQHVHESVAQEKSATKGGAYKPKALTAHEYATLQRLSDLIIPADEHSPGALAAGSADFIDFLCNASDEMRDIYTGGLMWLDEATQKKHSKAFVDASPEQQTGMLDVIAWRKNASPENGPGIEFFAFCRRMVADAYYSHPIGYKELGFIGNSAMSSFSVPKEAVEYALKRSGLG